MKRKINLLSLSKNELKKVTGATAGVCSCGCLYADGPDGEDDDFYGGSSIEENGRANMKRHGNTWYHVLQ